MPVPTPPADRLSGGNAASNAKAPSADRLVHIFDAIARDQRVLRATEDEIEVEYISDHEADDSDSEGGWRGRRRPQKAAQLNNREYVIHLFGCLADGTPVRLEVNGFKPFFFLELPVAPGATRTEEEKAKAKVQALINKHAAREASSATYELEHHQKLYGYTGGRTFTFLKITVPSIGHFYNLRKIFLDEDQKPRAGYKVYESNLDPMLRFFHLRDLAPCGWVAVAKAVELESEDDTLLLRAEWTDVSPSQAPAGVVSAPFYHAFWDVECYSPDGEFPVAKQGYRRVAKQLWARGVSVQEGVEELVAAFAGSGPLLLPSLLKPHLRPKEKELRKALGAGFQKKLDELLAGRETLAPKEREGRVQAITTLLESALGSLAPLAGDPIIQIGTVAVRGSCSEKHIFVLGGCAPVEGAIVHHAATEKELLRSWFEWLTAENFDVFCGYNIFGFDEHYVWERLEELGLEQDECVQRLTRLFDEGGQVKLEEKMLSSSALGDNLLRMWSTAGRLRIDLYSHIKRKTQMPSYKLDAVAAAFLSGKLQGIEAVGANRWLLKTKQKGDARVGRYVQVLDAMGEDLTEKAAIVELVPEGIVVEAAVEEDYRAIAGEAVKWAVVKDDVPPQELFRLHRGSDEDRARIASYCVQDCDLVYELYKKLDVFNEAMSMANVCSVPVGYIFTRGQGIKIESLIFKDCMSKNQLIEVMPRAGGGQDEDSYEGAIVLDPEPGFYTESPVGVCDFASLYPSTIISENISHDMLVWVKDFDMEGKLVAIPYGSPADEAYAPSGTRWTDIEFDIWRPDPADTRKHPTKIKAGIRLCRYAQPPSVGSPVQPQDPKGSLPQIVAKLLAARKAKRAEIPKTDDPFKKALLDAEQNAYKVTANSLYGQLGSRTFKIRLQHLAASVTAHGRKQILFARDAILKFYGPEAKDPRCAASGASIVYGDTDSLFVAFNPKDPETGEPLRGREAIVKTIELTTEAGHFITGALKAPHDFEYDKTMFPFIIFSKKRYVGNLYEEDPDKFVQTSMGIVLKRRDNAPLLKMCYGAAIDALLNRRDVAEATRLVKEQVCELTDGKMKLSQLTITKSLRAEYATSPPAHKVLADRIAARDPGNAPASGERIGYVYVQPPTGQAASKLQGDRVETPAFIEANGLQPDAEYYIEHQLYNPLAQLFGLLVERMPGFLPPASWNPDPEKRIGQREAIAGDLLFREGLAACRQAAARAFMAAMGGTTTARTDRLAKPLRLAPPAPAVPAEVAKRQSTLFSYLKDTALMSDDMLASQLKAVRKGKAAAKATAATVTPPKAAAPQGVTPPKAAAPKEKKSKDQTAGASTK